MTRNILMRFPGGKAKALTLSYDDGVEQDIRLIEIMRQSGLKGTFNINSGLYAKEGTVYPEGHIHRRMTRKQCIELYRENGMEVAVHGLTHPFLYRLSENQSSYEVIQDRMNLENEFDTIVRGMAYPFGPCNDKLVEVLKSCGIAYSRTTVTTEKFDIPTDWLRLSATCHHNNPRLMELAHQFVELSEDQTPALFYLWGHSFEFEQDDNWNVIEEFAKYLGNREDIWYATNIEVYDYVTAYQQLIFSTDGMRIYNPTAFTVYLLVDGVSVRVKPGEQISL